MLKCRLESNACCPLNYRTYTCSACILFNAKLQGQIVVHSALKNSVCSQYTDTFYQMLQKHIPLMHQNKNFPQINSIEKLIQAINESFWVETSHRYLPKGYRLFVTDSFSGHSGFVRLSELHDSVELIATETADGFFKLNISNVIPTEVILTFLTIQVEKNQIENLYIGEPFAPDLLQIDNLTNGKIISTKIAKTFGFKFAEIIS